MACLEKKTIAACSCTIANRLMIDTGSLFFFHTKFSSCEKKSVWNLIGQFYNLIFYEQCFNLLLSNLAWEVVMNLVDMLMNRSSFTVVDTPLLRSFEKKTEIETSALSQKYNICGDRVWSARGINKYRIRGMSKINSDFSNRVALFICALLVTATVFVYVFDGTLEISLPGIAIPAAFLLYYQASSYYADLDKFNDVIHVHTETRKTLREILQSSMHKKNSLLHTACLTQNVSMVRLIVDIAPNCNVIDAHNDYKATPLQLAVCIGNVPITQILVNAGADINKEDFFSKQTPDHLARSMGHKDIVDLLRGNSSFKQTPPKKIPLLNFEYLLHSAVSNSDRELLDFCLSKNYSIRAQDPATGNLPIHIAAQVGFVAAMPNLIDMTSDQSLIDVPNNRGNTPLFEACQNKRVDPVKWLLENGANFLIQGEARTTFPFATCDFSDEVFRQIVSTEFEIAILTGDEKRAINSLESLLPSDVSRFTNIPVIYRSAVVKRELNGFFGIITEAFELAVQGRSWTKEVVHSWNCYFELYPDKRGSWKQRGDSIEISREQVVQISDYLERCDRENRLPSNFNMRSVPRLNESASYLKGIFKRENKLRRFFSAYEILDMPEDQKSFLETLDKHYEKLFNYTRNNEGDRKNTELFRRIIKSARDKIIEDDKQRENEYEYIS